MRERTPPDVGALANTGSLDLPLQQLRTAGRDWLALIERARSAADGSGPS